MRIVTASALALIGVFVLSACADPPVQEETAEQSAGISRGRWTPPPPPPPPPPPLGPGDCVHASFERVGNHVQGWAIDLCDPANPMTTTMFMTGPSFPSAGKRVFGWGSCEYWEFASAWCSPTTEVTVTIGDQTYTGMYGFDIDPLAGGLVSSFDADQVKTGSMVAWVQETVFPFDETF